MTSYDELIKKIPEVEKRLGYTFVDKKRAIRAFLHSSYLNETKLAGLKHNECFEFVGDAVLNLITAEILFSLFPNLPEGELSSMRSIVVSAASCTQYIQKMDIAEFLVVGKGEKLLGTKAKAKSSMLPDLFEAILGAIYLDGGIDAAKLFFQKNGLPIMQELLQKPNMNWKASLQEFTQKKWQLIPKYKITSQTGPEHEREFVVAVFINEKIMGEGKGLTKKEAEQEAAKIALEQMKDPKK